MKRPVGRAIALGAMTLVTAWSLWAWAQQPAMREGHGHEGHRALQAPAALQGAPPAAARAPAGTKATEAAEAKESAEAKEAEEAGPKPINWTDFGGEYPPFIAMLINFAILAAGYYYLGRKPIAAGLQSRRDTIAKDIDEAQRMKREAEERAKVYQAKLDKLEEEAKNARESILRAGEAERERIVREAEAKAERMRKDAEFMVEQEIKQLRVDLWRDTVEVAITAAEQLLGQRVTGSDQERLAEEYLAELAAPKSGAIAGRGAS